MSLFTAYNAPKCCYVSISERGGSGETGRGLMVRPGAVDAAGRRGQVVRVASACLRQERPESLTWWVADCLRQHWQILIYKVI